MTNAARPSLLFVQNGDFLEATRRFAAGEAETYLDQKTSVDHVTRLSDRLDVTVASVAARPYDETPRPGLRTIGVPHAEMYGSDFAPRLLDEVRPALCMPKFPHAPLLQALHAHAIRSFPCFADLFSPITPRDLLGRAGLGRLRFNFRVKRALASPFMVAVGNHSLSASVSLRDVLGIEAARIVPWEWTRLAPPPDPGPPVDRGGAPFVLVYAGALVQSKGIGDLIAALGLTAPADGPLRLTVFGTGADEGALRAQALRLPDHAAVDFAGSRPNSEVRAAMAAADAVVVPSRHSYAEGLPNVIFEALAAGAPLILSDHPAFRARLRDADQALVARASDPGALAGCIGRLQRDAGLRHALRRAAGATLDSLYVGRSWYALMDAFLEDPENRSGWVQASSLAALGERARAPAI